MKRTAKPVFFIVFVIILALAYTAIFGVYGENGDFRVTYIKGINDIRWGIDINGGVEVSFSPKDTDATKEEMESVKAILELRMVALNITDYEIYPDYDNDTIMVRFPWKSGETDFDPKTAVDELGKTAALRFIPGDHTAAEIKKLLSSVRLDDTGAKLEDDEGNSIPKTAEEIKADLETVKGWTVLEGKQVKRASAEYQQNKSGVYEHQVALELTDEGAKAFEEATRQYVGKIIYIWMDDQLLSSPTVNEVITGGHAVINGYEDREDPSAEAKKDADTINAGALPFALSSSDPNTLSPSLGNSALTAMAYAAVAAMILIFLFMIFMYRLPGFIAFIALIGQMTLSIMAVSGYFANFPSFTMTIPGIAGMILSIGMGVDANIITAERIKDELCSGKTLDGCIRNGTKGSFSAIFDGNVTVIIVAIILILVFGPANIFSAIFGVSPTGMIYAFGYTLLVGVIANFIMGVGASRLMLKSLSGYKFLRNKRLYGGKKTS